MCGRPVRRVSLGLDDLFADEDAEPELPSAANIGAAADGGNTQLQTPGITPTDSRCLVFQLLVCMPALRLQYPPQLLLTADTSRLQLADGARTFPFG